MEEEEGKKSSMWLCMKEKRPVLVRAGVPAVLLADAAGTVTMSLLKTEVRGLLSVCM